MKLILLLTFLPTFAFLITGMFSGYLKSKKVINLSLFSAVLSIVIALGASVYVYLNEVTTIYLFSHQELGFTFRLDALSLVFYTMIALLSFIIVRYSATYLEGDENQGRFIGRFASTIASVQLFVISGNLFILFISWVFTSLFLHRLLTFYGDRPRARTAARKKFIVGRIGDFFLLISFTFIYLQYGTGDLGIIFSEIAQSSSANMPSALQTSAVFLVLAAFFKSAQFPSHGWLVEVMETPTPVSALLHAGLLNAGPFIVMRFSLLMNHSIAASEMLLIVGGFTALFASIVFMTQPAIKTSLGYSSVAHMGFSFFICGTGAYSAAVLHIVAHSFYKGHAFLSSGSVVDIIRAKRISLPNRLTSPLRISIGIFLTLALYFAVAYLFNPDLSNNFSLLAVGLVIIMGLAQFLIPIIDSKPKKTTVLIASFLGVMVSFAFFGFEGLFDFVLNDQLPHSVILSTLQIVTISILLLIFGSAVIVQLFYPNYFVGTTSSSIGVHLRNGFYINTHFDKLIGAYKVRTE
ncbi:MAG: proton-conducting transporter membrane subunit [Brumimicrobium sp.]|nr:proton-conducting transporter membrane subunit [Brumimicrobium sp.]